MRELKDLVILLETDRRGLKEHIAQLCASDIAPVASADPGIAAEAEPSTPTTNGDTNNTGDGDSQQQATRFISAPRPLETTPPRQKNTFLPTTTPSSTSTSTSTSNQEPDTLNTIGLWLNSGLVSASTAVRSFEGFDFGESKYYYGKQSSEKKERVKDKSLGVLSQKPESVASNDSSVANADATSPKDTTQTCASTLETPSSNPTNTIVISQANLQQAQYTTSVHTSTDKSPSLRNSILQSNVENTGSDCGSVTDDDAEVGKSTKSGKSKRKSQPTGALNALSRESTSDGTSELNAAGSDNNDSTIHKVTEQLYGILPSWGTLAKVTKF